MNTASRPPVHAAAAPSDAGVPKSASERAASAVTVTGLIFANACGQCGMVETGPGGAVPGLRRRRCSARRRYQRGPLKVAQATPWLIDQGDLLAVAQRAVQCPASCNALVIAVPIAPAQAVTTAACPRAKYFAVVMASHRLRRIVWP